MFTWNALFYTSLVVLVVVDPQRPELLVFRNRCLVWLGTVSYGVYITHEGVRCLLHALVLHRTAEVDDWPSLGVTLLAIGVTLCLAQLSWRFFEQPLIRRAQARYQYAPAESMLRRPLKITSQVVEQ